MLKKQEDLCEDHQEEMWQMSKNFHCFSCPFDPQKYEDIFTQAYSVWLNMETQYPIEVEIPEPDIIQLRNKTKINFYDLEPLQQKEITIEDYEKIVQNGAKDEELQKKSRDLARQLCKTFKQCDIFFTKQQIKNILKDPYAFLKEKKTSMKLIRKVLKYVARTLLIYQAYFNEYFQKPGVNTQLKIKYEKELDYLRREYKVQMENINKTHPGKIERFYEKFLNLEEYSITLRKIYELQSKNHKEGSQIFQKQPIQQKVFVKVDDDLQEKVDQKPEIKIQYQEENSVYQINYSAQKLHESMKELSLQQGIQGLSSDQDRSENDSDKLDKDKGQE